MMHPARQKTGPLFAKISIWVVALAILGGIAVSLYRHIYYEGAIGAASLIIFCWVQLGFNRRLSRSRLRVPTYMQLYVSFLTFTSVFLGRFFALYRTIAWYDKSQHLLYGMVFCVMGLVAFYLLNPAQRLELTAKPFFVGLFAACFGLACCFGWELYEFSNDRLFGTNMQAWKQDLAHGLIDTMGDLIAGLVGALLIGWLAGLSLRRNPTAFYRTYIAGFLADDRPASEPADPIDRTNPTDGGS